MSIKKITVLLVLLFWSNMILAASVIKTIDDLSRGSKLSTEQREQGRKTLLLIVANCEFNEACMLNHIVPLRVKYEKERNPMYVWFSNYLHGQRDAFERDSRRCHNKEKKATRKVYAECLKARIESEAIAGSLTGRAKIDKLDDNQDICLKNSLEKLAVEGNIFAQAHMVNFAQLMSDSKSLDYWYNLIQKQVNTIKYQEFQKCNDLP